MKVVVTVVGEDQVGIIAAVTALLAKHNINVQTINQNIVDGIFNMILIADMSKSNIHLKDLQSLIASKGKEMGLEMKVQHGDIFHTMHRI